MAGRACKYLPPHNNVLAVAMVSQRWQNLSDISVSGTISCAPDSSFCMPLLAELMGPTRYTALEHAWCR